MGAISSTHKMICPRCGAQMNHHADKLLRAVDQEGAGRSISVWVECSRSFILALIVVMATRATRRLRPATSGESPGRPTSRFPYSSRCRYTVGSMSNQAQPNIKLVNAPDYRENYANSVQVRVNVWDFFLVFGTLQQQSETQVEVRNFQGIYLSPQQAKALMAILQQNVAGYESTFGEIKLDPRMMAPGPVH